MFSNDILNKKENIFYSLFYPFYEDNRTYLKFYSGKRLISTYTYNQFYKSSFTFSLYLQQELNIQKGDKILVRLGNTDTALISYCAIMLLGAIIIPVDPTDTIDSIEYMMSNSKAKLIIQSTNEKFSCQSLCFDTQLFSHLEQDQTTKELNSVNKDDTALIVYTSGTTNKPKGVVLSYKNLIANAVSVTQHHNMNHQHIHMCILPLFHVNAFNFSFFATLFIKARLILNRHFYLPNFWDIVQNESVHVVSAVPKIINLLVQDQRQIKLKSKNLKYFTSAAAPLSNVLAQKFYERFSIKILQGYGMSEAVNFSLTMPTKMSEELYTELLKEKILSVGVPIQGNIIEILNEHDEVLAQGEIGEVVIRGNNVMSHYYNNPEESKKTLRKDFLHTGDRGFYLYKEKKRFFYLVGRLKELIIKDGENISPIELDYIIQKNRGLESSCVVGFPNRYTEEEIGLCVVKNEYTQSEKEILKLCLEQLGPKRAPKAVIFVESLPVTSTGKIQRLKLVTYFKPYETMDFK